MTDQAELDRIILQLLGKEDHVGNKSSIILYEDDEIVKLDLSDLALTSLPDGFFNNFIELRELNLSYNAFEEIPDGLFKELTNLRKLDLSYMIDPSNFTIDEVVTLPANLLETQNELKVLNLSGNQLESLPDTFFSNLYGLEVLDLSYNLLSLLPPSIGTCVNLEQLYLESNFLPIEFSAEYIGYAQVQEFIAPFQQEWVATHEPVFVPGDNPDTSKQVVEEELKKAFSMLEDLFD